APRSRSRRSVVGVSNDGARRLRTARETGRVEADQDAPAAIAAHGSGASALHLPDLLGSARGASRSDALSTWRNEQLRQPCDAPTWCGRVLSPAQRIAATADPTAVGGDGGGAQSPGRIPTGDV